MGVEQRSRGATKKRGVHRGLKRARSTTKNMEERKGSVAAERGDNKEKRRCWEEKINDAWIL